MSEPPKLASRYLELRSAGLRMFDADIDHVLDLLTQGAHQVFAFLEISPDELSWPAFMFTDQDRPFGYVFQLERLAVPIPTLNRIADCLETIPWAQLMNYPLGEGGPPVHTEDSLRNVAREETVHMLQRRGVSDRLRARITPENTQWHRSASQIERELCAVEVEARETTDAIVAQQGGTPIWREYNVRLREKYPQQYGQEYPQVVTRSID